MKIPTIKKKQPPNIQYMTIAQIKAQLSIQSVLQYYGLQPNRNQMLRCPFHEDQKASMKVYPDTNTVYCFAGSCQVSNLDVIDFIMKMDKSNKQEAIMKAKAMVGALPSVQVETPAVEKVNNKAVVDAFQRYLKSLHSHRKAQEYCTDRRLDWQELDVGYKSQKTKDRWGRNCIIFPLKDEQNNIVSLYGRSIEGSGHYYQNNRSGLYPKHPAPTIKTLILCESIIDTATLQQVDLPLADYALLSLFGTNGLSKEHRQVIQQLDQLEEVVLGLDGDAAGKKATVQVADAIRILKPKIKYSTLELPEGEDVNSLAVSHDDWKELFAELFKNRKQLLDPLAQDQAKPAVEPVTSKLNTDNPNSLIYTGAAAKYYIKGGVRSSAKDFDSLKITLVVENTGNVPRKVKSRNKLDLYEDKQVEKVSRQAAEKLELRADLIELDLQALTDELENYREELHRTQEAPVVKVQLAAGMKEACLQFLKQPELMQHIDEKLEGYGLIGEHNNRRLGFCIVSSYGMAEPLHGLIQGSSGSGKTHLLSKLCNLIPPEYYIPITRATDNSFYNYQPYELKHKLISVEDKDAMSEEANLAFRELQTKGMVSSSTTGQDDQGNNRSFVKLVYGPIASLACTTKGELYLDDMNRCFLMAVDESQAQTQRILDYQKQLAAGLINVSDKQQIESFMRACLRLLKPYQVVIPYAPDLHLPEAVKDKRRLNGLYLSLVKQVTLLHQYQRKEDEKGRLISQVEDLKIANAIMFDAIVLKVDELHGSLRTFYEKLKAYVREMGGEQTEQYAFRQREVRQTLRLSKSALAQNLKELVELEYLQIASGSEYRGYHYKISYWDDNEAMRSRIRHYLDQQIIHLSDR